MFTYRAVERGYRQMQITDVRVRKVTKEGKLKAVVSITLDEEFVVHDIKVIEGEKGLFIAMPSRKAVDGEYRDIAHPIIEPRMFSFNNPAGACPKCAGLGDMQVLSVDKILPHRELSLHEGGIAVNGFKSLEEESWNGPLFSAVGARHGFSLDTPLENFTPTAMDVLLHGSGQETYDIYRYFGGEEHHQVVRFEGLLPMIRARMTQGMNKEYYEQ